MMSIWVILLCPTEENISSLSVDGMKSSKEARCLVRRAQTWYELIEIEAPFLSFSKT